MPDIAMCMGVKCPIRENCYRYKAVPNFRQTYFEKAPIKNCDCDYYWPLKSEDEKRTNIQKKGKGVDKGIKPLRG